MQDLLADLLEPRADALAAGDGAPGSAGTEWPLRGEILAHVDRLRTGLTRRYRRRPGPVSARRSGGAPARQDRGGRSADHAPAARLRADRQLLREASRSRSSAQRAR